MVFNSLLAPGCIIAEAGECWLGWFSLKTFEGFILASSFLSAVSVAPYLTNQQVGTYSGYSSTGQYVQGTYVGTTTNKTVEYMAQQENTARIDSFTDQMNAALSFSPMDIR